MTTLKPEELKAKLDAKEVLTLIDLRPNHDYQEKHIPGAMNVAAGATFVAECSGAVPDKATVIVLYNDLKENHSDQESAAALEAAGYTNVSIVPDGLMGWMNAGFQVEFGRES